MISLDVLKIVPNKNQWELKVLIFMAVTEISAYSLSISSIDWVPIFQFFCFVGGIGI
jgi:hypothetical protein